MSRKLKFEKSFKINWGKLSEVGLKDFLKEDSWKLFINNVELEERLRENCLKVMLLVPKLIFSENRFLENIKDVLKMKLESISSMLKKEFLIDESVPLLIDVQAKSTSDKYSHFELEQKYLGSELKNWIRHYFNGRAFAYEIERNEEQYIFFDYQFVKNNKSEDIWDTLKADNRPIFIYGNPKSGKTYTALYLFYKVFCKECIRVEFFSNVNNFLSYIESFKKGKLKEDKIPIYIYMEDPFGGLTYDDESVRELITGFNYKDLPNNVKVVFTSRKSPYLKAVSEYPEQKIFFNQMKVFEFELSTEREEKSRLYQNSDFEDMLERMAWLFKAKWLNSFRSYRKNRSKYFYWNKLVLEKNAPGSLFYAFKIFPNIIKYLGNNKKEIEEIAFCLNSTDNLEAAFNSEYMMTLDQSQKIAVKLYFLLPIMIKIDNRDYIIKTIFDKKEQKEIEVFKDILVKRKKIEMAFHTKSFVYFHSTFAEAAFKYLKMNRRPFFKEIFRYLYDKIKNANTEIPAWILRDLLCNFYALALGRLDSDEDGYLWKIYKSLPPKSDEQMQVRIFKFIFSLQEINNVPKEVKEFTQSIITSEKSFNQISYIASLIDQLIALTVVDDYFYPVQNLLGNFIRRFIDANCKEKENKPYLRISLFIHSILSKFEVFIPNDKDYTGSDLKPIIETIKENNIYRSLFDLSWSTMLETGQFIELSIVWIDAVFMKIGELHYYLRQNQVLIEGKSGIKDKKSSLLQNIKIANALKDSLWEKFLFIWKETNHKLNPSQKKYLIGAMTFIINWHNRWSFKPGKRIVEWINKNILASPDNTDEEFWQGVMFNINYHREYFYYKSEAWERESSILIWKIRNPRMGADHLYESGLNLSNPLITNDLKVQSFDKNKKFFIECLDYFIRGQKKEVIEAEIDTESIVFIIGTRIPNDPELAEAYLVLLKEFDEVNNSKKNGLINGIAKLKAFNFRESLDLIVKESKKSADIQYILNQIKLL